MRRKLQIKRIPSFPSDFLLCLSLLESYNGVIFYGIRKIHRNDDPEAFSTALSTEIAGDIGIASEAAAVWPYEGSHEVAECVPESRKLICTGMAIWLR